MPKRTAKTTNEKAATKSKKQSSAKKPGEAPLVDTGSLKPSVSALVALADRLDEEFEGFNDASMAPHLIVAALAGCGKTTTLVEGLKRVKGLASKFTPSPQQAAVWEEMMLSRGVANSICFCAFNKGIATELQAKIPPGCVAMTMHSLGNRAVSNAYGKLRLNQYRINDLISDLLQVDIWELRKKELVMLTAVQELVGLCKQNLIGIQAMNGHEVWGEEEWEEALDTLCGYYEVELNGSKDKVFKLVPQILELCRTPQRDGCFDFNDMIWLPVVNNLPCYKYNVLLVDEAQDLNRCQQQLALKSGERLILCGDKNQAIYGFAGADAESMDRMAEILGGTERSVKTLPLTVTRRCGKAIVREAQQIVKDFEAFETNGEGLIRRTGYETYSQQVEDGDFLLCRTNGPLVSQCFKFLKAGRKANIQGRDVGQGLISTVKKLCKDEDKRNDIDSVPNFITALDVWHQGEVKKLLAKRNPPESRLIALGDRKECLEIFCNDVKTVNQLIAKIESVFTDSQTAGIRLSSIHKAKGLEAKRVFLLEPKGSTVPHPMAKSEWQRGQEWNLRYVAITRAIEELVYVTEE